MYPATPTFSENHSQQVEGRFLKGTAFNRLSVSFVPRLCGHLQDTKVCFWLITLPPAEGLSLSHLMSEGSLSTVLISKNVETETHF